MAVVPAVLRGIFPTHQSIARGVPTDENEATVFEKEGSAPLPAGEQNRIQIEMPKQK